MTQKRPVRRRLALVPFAYRRWLLSGQPYCFIYLSQEGKRCRAMWKAFGEIVCERYARKRPFRRPANWWRFDAPRDRLPHETKFDYLCRHEELLFAWEKRRLLAQTQRLDQLCRELDDRSQ
jgi:hypothetical protein